MATMTVADFINLWNLNDEDSRYKVERIILKGIDKAQNERSLFVSKVPSGPSINQEFVTWLEERDYPTSVLATLTTGVSNTLTFSGDLFGSAISADTIRQIIRVGTILERVSDEVQVEVTDVTGLASTPFECTVVTHSGSTLSDNAVAEEWTIEGELWGDETEATNPRALDRVPRKVGCQIFAETFKITKSAANAGWTNLNGNIVSHNLQALIDKLALQEDKAYVRGKPKVNGSGKPVFGDEVEISKIMGLMYWAYYMFTVQEANPYVYVDMNGAVPTKADLDNLVRNMRLRELAKFTSGNWAILCHPNMKTHMQQWDVAFRRGTMERTTAGYDVDKVDLAERKGVPILDDITMRPSQLAIVDISQCEKGPYANDEMDRQPLPVTSRTKSWLVSYKRYGLVLRNARRSVGALVNCSPLALGE